MATILAGTVRHERDGEAVVVTVPAFELDVTEVTVADYASCVAAKKCQAATTRPGCTAAVTNRSDHPITCVTRDEAEAYCRWKKKRLPTLDEFDRAIRGPAESGFPWDTARMAPPPTCYDGEDNEVGKDQRAGTCPVAVFAHDRSPEGVYDLAGNVSEWVSDTAVDAKQARGIRQRGLFGVDDDGPDVSVGVHWWMERRERYQRGVGTTWLRRRGDWHFGLGFRCARTPVEGVKSPKKR